MIKEKDLVPGRVMQRVIPAYIEQPENHGTRYVPFMVIGFQTKPARRHSTSSLPASKKSWEIVVIHMGGKLDVIRMYASDFPDWVRLI